MAHNRMNPQLHNRAKALAFHLARAGWEDAARGLPAFVGFYGVEKPLAISDATIIVEETAAGVLIATYNGETVATEHGAIRRSEQEAGMPVRRFRCDEDLFHQLEVLAQQHHNSNMSAALRAAIRHYIEAKR